MSNVEYFFLVDWKFKLQFSILPIAKNAS